MFIRVNDIHTLDIEDEYARYSPYLSASMNTERKLTGDEYVHMEMKDIRILSNYLSFLRGGDFVMEEEDEQFFEIMGHTNTYNYPLPYWRVKLKSKWTRDNFYRLRLAERDNGLYGLVELPVINDPEFSLASWPQRNAIIYKESNLDISCLRPDTERDGIVMAGGAALYVAGIINRPSDIDLFSINKEKSLTFFRQGLQDDTRPKDMRKKRSRAIGQHFDVDVLRNSYARHGYSNISDKITLIRRVYTCPAEVVHGFDLDVCQFLVIFKEGKSVLYATEIGLYAVENDEQWYDPDMVSTTYIQRLAKYQSRGIKLRLPSISRKDTKTYMTVNGMKMTPSILLKSLYNINSQWRAREEVTKKNLPNDIGSILFYIAFFGEVRPRIIRALLNPEVREWKEYDQELEGIEDLWNLPWIEIDPMQQNVLSGIIYPIDKENLHDLYKASPLHREYIPDGRWTPNTISINDAETAISKF